MRMPGKKLLVADDSLTIQKVIRLALSNEGYDIQAVSDGNDAVQQMNLFQPDVVLIDVSLPGKSAFEVKREVNEEPDLQEIRFVLMSSAFEKVDEAQANEVKFHGRLTKPFDPAHLRQVLLDVLDQVAAKRMEKTSILTRTQFEDSLTPPPPLPDNPEQEGQDFTFPPDELPASNSDFPTLPDKPNPETHELWEPAQDPIHPLDLDQHAMPPLPQMKIPPSTDTLAFSDETDIKTLTESTLQSAGMNDYQWSVNELSIKPPSEDFDKEKPSFSLDHSLENALEHDGIESPPDFIAYSPPSSDLAASNSTLTPHLAAHLETDLEAKYQKDDSFDKRVEQQIQKQIEIALSKIAKDLLPEIAEKLIKKEIHRLLSE